MTINYTNTTGKQKAYTFIIFTYFQEQLFILSFQNEAVQFAYILALGFSSCHVQQELMLLCRVEIPLQKCSPFM